ncbi:MAG: RHS repeat-associated core domain-containing protein [Cytophagales bacterium]|nr:RHS repeat-associated core domain-containing protein [Cytophagales bacterium]
MYLQHLRATVLLVLILFSHQILSQTRTESEAVFSAGSNDFGALKNSVNLFTGEVEFPMTLISSVANGGMRMGVAASYNSNVNTQVNTWNRDAPTSVLGVGWSMNVPKIVVDNKQTGTRTDDEFFLVDGNSTPLTATYSTFRYVESHGASYNAKIYKTGAYNHWDIYYMEDLEMWEIIREDGTKVIYGDATNHPTSVEWVVHWDNWIGHSAKTSGQSRQAMVWNLANVEDLWGNTTTYTYDKVEHRVSAGSGGLYHTEASYLSEIEDGNGKRIELIYGNKNNYEYYEPHTEINYNSSTNVAEPDGYQERYERKYLSEVRSYNEYNNLLQKVYLDYAIYGSGDLRKRYLWKVTNVNAEGEEALPTEFTYNHTVAGYKGSLTRVTSPSGAYIQYNYNSLGHNIGHSDLDITINAPSGYEMPQVFHGNNYAVVAWRNPTNDMALVQIYEWDSKWNMVETRYYHDVGRQTNANPHIQARYTNLQITLEKDFVGIVHRYAGTTYLYAYSRNPNEQEWGNYSKNLNTEVSIQLVSGDKFIGLQEQTKGTLHALRFDGETWDYDLVKPEITSNFSQYYYATAGTNFISVHNPQMAQRGPNISNYTFFLSESGLWTEKIGPVVDIAYNNDRTWHAVNSAVFGIKSVGSEIAFDWDTDYNLKNTYTLTSYGTTTTNRLISIGNSLVSFNDKANAGNVNFNQANAMFMTRFDGATWKTQGYSDYWAEFSAIGDDYLLSGSGKLHRFNPNTLSWSSYVSLPGASTSNRKPALSLPGATYYWPYFRKFNNNGTYLDIYIPSAASNRGKDETHQAGGNFVIQNRYTTSTGVYFHYLKNNQVVSTYISGKRVPEYNNIAAGLDQFHLYTTSSSSDTYEDATSITLYKVKPDLNNNAKYLGAQKHYPVSYISYYDGVNLRYTSFDFEESSAKMDATGSKAFYSKATTYPGTSNKSSSIAGRTVTHFYNGLPLSYTHPNRNGSNEEDFEEHLVGQVYKTQVYSSGSVEQAYTYNYMKVVKTPITSFLGPLAYQYQVQPVAKVDKKDALERSYNYYYNSLNQLSRTETSYVKGYGTYYVNHYQYYIWEYYPTAAQQHNLLSPVVYTKWKDSGTWRAGSVTTWKDWGSGAWAPRSNYNWRGTGSEPTFTSWTTNGGTVTNWERTNDITARTSNGNVKESRDVDNRYTALRYGYDDELPLLSVYDAYDHEIFVDDFNDGNLSDGEPVSWNGSSWTNLNGVISNSSSASSERTLTMTSYHSATSFIVEYDARVRSSNYGSWVGFRMKGTSSTAGNGEYVVKFYPNVGIVQLVRNGTALVSSPYGGVTNVNEWKHFRIERQNNSNFQIFVDGDLVISHYVPGSGSGAYHGFSAYGSCTVDFDNFRMYPQDGVAQSTSYDKTFKTLESVTDQYGAISKSLYNDWQQSVASINENGIPQTTNMASSSRFRSNSNYVSSDPGTALSTAVNGLTGFVEDFAHINPRWSTESYSTKSIWYLTNGKLGLSSLGGNTVSTPDAYKIDLGKDFSGRVGIEFNVRQRDNTGNRGFGIAIGDGSLNQYSNTSAIMLSFRSANILDYCNSSNCTATSGWSTATSQVHYGKQHRVKIIADTDTDKADIYVNGRLYKSDLTFRKASSVIRKIRLLNYGRGSSTEWKIDNLVVYENPVHQLNFIDAGGKVIQTQTEEPNDKILVSESFYDQIGRAAITTKTTRTSSTANFGYRSGFVTNSGTAPPSTLSGEVKTWNNNDSYAFSRTRYEVTPLSRPLESSMPGYLYRVNGGQNPIYTYSTNSSSSTSDFYMGTGYNANTYSATRVTDNDGSKKITFRDKQGRLIMEKEGPVKISTRECAPNDVVDSRYYSWYASPSTPGQEAYTPANDVTLTINMTKYSTNGSFQIGTGFYGYGLSNVFSSSSSGTYTVNLTGGQTVYFNWTSGYVGSVSVSMLCGNAAVIEKDAYLTTKYDYNYDGELVKIYHPNYFDLPPAGVDRDDYTSTYTYDDQGNIATSTTPDQGTTRYLYDSENRLMFYQDANGSSSNYVKYHKYDSYDRLIEEGYWYRSWTGLTASTSVPTLATWRKKYLYGSYTSSKLYEKNRLREVQVNNDESSDVEVYERYTYDVFGQITDHETRVVDFDNTYHKISYTYNNSGQALSTDYGSGFSPVLYGYYKENGALKEIGSSSYSSEYGFYTYDKNGNLEYEYLDWKTKPFKYNYDITGRLTSIDDTYNYYYDQNLYYTSGYGGTNNTGVINRTVNTYRTTSTFFNGLASKPTSHEYRYNYDKIGQLKVADHTTNSGLDIGIYNGRENQYDANGNMLRRQEGTGNSSYNHKQFSYYEGTNRVKNSSGSTSLTHQYDASGNQTSNATNYASMQYDKGFDKIDYFSRYGSYSWFQYGANNQRVMKRADPSGSAPEVKTMYVRGLSDYPLVERINDNGTIKKRFYIYGPMGLVASNIDNIDYFHVKDYHGSTRVLFQQGGSISAWFDYKTYGNLAASYNNQLSTYRYTGQEYDNETGVYNYRARFYDATLGAFYSTDPQNQFSSPYTAMGNNPVMMVDPDGEIAWFVPIIIGAAVNVGINAYEGNINNFWDGLGYAAVGAAAGALGGGLSAGVSSALGGTGFGAGFSAAFSGSAGLAGSGLTAATTSFFSGAAIGGIAGVGSGFVTGLGNGLVGGENIEEALRSGLREGAIGGLSRGLIGGVAGGYKAVKDGRRFFDGATVQDQVLVDRQLQFVRQQGNMNCGPANCESISQSRGGGVTQQSIRNSLGGNANTTPLGDLHVANEFTAQSGIRNRAIAGGLDPNRALQYMRSGYDVTYNIRGTTSVGHAVTINRITERTITKVSGKVVNKLIVEVMNPAVGQYVNISNSTLINAYNTFLFFP